VRIEERGALCRSLDAALRAAGEQGHQAFLDEVVKEIAQTRVDLLRLTVGDVTPIAPGETRTVALPPPVSTARRHRASALRVHLVR
jgi:hypothetical protein